MEIGGLPKDWLFTPVSSICDIVRGVTFKKSVSISHSQSGYIPVLRANGIQDGRIVLDDLVYVPEEMVAERQLIREGDVVIAMSSGSKALVGKAAWSEKDIPVGFGAFCGILRPSDKLESRYFGHFFQSKDYRNSVSELSAGVNINNLKPAHFNEILFPVAPWAEQTRIANKLDELLAQVDTIKARVDAIPGILKRFRQSVLAAAVSGRLTEEWRVANQVDSDWKEVNFSSLIDKLRGGAGDKPTADEGGVAILRSSAVRNMDVDYTDVRYLDRDISLKPENFLKNGDLLFTRLSGSAEYVGNCARVVGVCEEEIQYPDRLFCAKLAQEKFAPYLEIFFSSTRFRRHIAGQLKSSAGHQRITLGAIRNAVVALPSFKEQTQIVQLVTLLFELADQLERSVANAQMRIESLSPSALGKAFRGELVAQNPDDEPASALLERIEAEKESHKK